MTKNKKAEEVESYPWAKLYDMESGVPGTGAAYGAGRTGRPYRPFPRTGKTVYLSDEEKAIFNRDLFRLMEVLPGSKVNQYQLIGLALRLLDNRLKFLPERATSWDEIVKAIFEGDTASE